MNTKNLKTIYFALVQSILTYGLIAWGGGYSSTVQAVSVAQNNILRAILKKKKIDSATEMYKELTLLPVTDLYRLTTLTRLVTHFPVEELLSHGQGTRAEVAQLLPSSADENQQGDWSYIAPVLYNALPAHLRGVRGKKFRLVYRDYLISLENPGTGEPPLCLSVAVTFALRNAVESARKDAGIKQEAWFDLDHPITPERTWLGCLTKKEHFKLQ